MSVFGNFSKYLKFLFPVLILFLYIIPADNMALTRVEYEVFGLVQGVFFRKYTESQAKQLQLRGWVRNTAAGTVEGVLEGPTNAVQEMKNWLETKGSPQSRIDRAIFKNEEAISEYTFQDFSIKRS
ncbi:acylphosphatase-1 [Aethina tumida]|uniref:acylphosphatase-1 n=1 Tax=Aethina tumida TaxID=116153 RepID=UPI002147E4BB|nr:acylphosphatase-1 [Aethina tumida]